MKTRPLYSLLLLTLLLGNAAFSLAADKQDLMSVLGVSLEQHASQYIGKSVAENIVNMDTDHNGFADVDEVRAYLVLKHGADYQKEVLDRWAVSAKGKSCGTSLIKELSDN